MKSYVDLEVYKRAYQLALEIHKLTMNFPKHEMYELGSQLRRASKSIALNIAEGYGRKRSAEEFKHFLTIALGSCDEARIELNFSRDLGYISEEEYEKYNKEYDVLGRMLNKLIQNWKSF